MLMLENQIQMKPPTESYHQLRLRRRLAQTIPAMALGWRWPEKEGIKMEKGRRNQEYALPQNGHSNRGSRSGALLLDDDGGNNQTESGESSIAILNNRMPLPTDPHVLKGSKKSNVRKTSLDSKLADKQLPRAQNFFKKNKTLPKKPKTQLP